MLDFRTIHSLHREIRAIDSSNLRRAASPETYASVPLVDVISSHAFATDGSASDHFG